MHCKKSTQGFGWLHADVRVILIEQEWGTLGSQDVARLKFPSAPAFMANGQGW